MERSSEVAALYEGPGSSTWARHAGDDFAWHPVSSNLVDDPGIINAGFAMMRA